MIVREMHRRCSYDQEALTSLLELSSTKDGTRTGRSQDRLLATLMSHYKASGFFSARILDVIDEDNIGLVDRHALAQLIESLPKKPFPIISIHDCFRAHPLYANDLRKAYNQILSEIAASDLLSFIASQISGQDLRVTKLADLSQQILQADYALC
jgi:hypothetical protein